ncbi:MAG: hypothetical protein M3220_18720 [Chloroflexota bacterium]|nr:hypothetical protein [Chloroflexota bacterium]
MQRMKWIADWEYVLGVNLLNPHGFHYTLEGARKRDWPPSMFYQYPWWHYYGEFSDYISRLSYLLTGGRHVAKVAVIWPINAMFATYTPQSHNDLGDRIEGDFNVLTDLLLRLHYDFDYLDEDILAEAELQDGKVHVRDEDYELVILPPMTHLKLSTLEQLERFAQEGGQLLGTIFLPDRAFGPDGLVDISDRVQALFGVNPTESQRTFRDQTGIDLLEQAHPAGGKSIFLRSYALARQLPLRLQQELSTPGRTESPFFVIESEGDTSRYYFAPAEGERQEITAEVEAERQAVADALREALNALVTPDVVIDNPEIFCLHRVKNDRDLHFLVNPTFSQQAATVTLNGQVHPRLWDPSTGEERPVAPSEEVKDGTRFQVILPPVGSAFVITRQVAEGEVNGRVTDTNLTIDAIAEEQVKGYGRVREGYITLERNGTLHRFDADGGEPTETLVLDGEWEFEIHDPNALVISHWLATGQAAQADEAHYAAPGVDTSDWLPMVPGAWAYQLPAEPTESYPLPVWYRVTFGADYVPEKTEVIVDGFAGSEWRLYVNGQVVTEPTVRSAFDSQMQAVDITELVQAGDNVVTICLTVTGPTDGLLDPVKVVGEFSLTRDEQGAYRIAPPRQALQPAPWTEQGYPFFSGRASYRRTFQLPKEFQGQRIFVEPLMGDDALEVLVNGNPVAVRLWAPYEVEITDFLQPGDNTLELRVANTLINLLEAVERPSGLSGAPRLVPYRRFSFDLSTQQGAPETTSLASEPSS